MKLLLWSTVAALAIAAVAGIYLLTRRPPWQQYRARRTFSRAGLCNALGELPLLLQVRRDRNKENGRILKISNKGVSIPDFERETARLEAGLNGKLYAMAYGRSTRVTYLYLLPWRFVHPTLISPEDDAIGPVALSRFINLLVVGATGTGKTVAIKIILSKIAKFQSNSKIWLLDFKQFDFRYFSDTPRYYGYTDCMQGLQDYYDAFKRQQALGVAGVPNYLIIDEWGAFLTSLGKKEAELAKCHLSEILMLGRAYRYYPIIGIQRPDAAYFQAARDNFQACLALGNLSPEGRRMVFPESVTGQITPCQKQEGHLYIDGLGLEKIRVADVPDLKALDLSILQAMGGGGAEQEPPRPPEAGGYLTN